MLLKIRGHGAVSVDWSKSYLVDRQLVVTINRITSGTGYVKCGVPQGSILGPLLFLCFVYDMYTSVNADS